MNQTAIDGWHKVYGYNVLIEDGYVSRATDGAKPLYPYRKYRKFILDSWYRIYKEEKLTLTALRSGMRRGTITLR